jgi:hypothetical protein
MPWWPALWDNNYFVGRLPALEPILTNNFVRGAITGLGLVNLAAGFSEMATVFAARAPSATEGPDPVDRGPQEWSGGS